MFAKRNSGTFASRATICMLVVLAHSGTAQAADAASDAAATPHPSRLARIGQSLAGWQLVVGAGAMIAPEYEGSDAFAVTPVPFVSATLFDVLTIDPGGASMTVLEQGPFELSARLGYEVGRQADDSDHLRGLGDIDFGATIGMQAAMSIGPVEFFARADRTIGGSEGLVGRLGVEVAQPLSQSLVIGAGASAVLADDKHMQAYFGVDAQQAANSGLARYDAEAGLKRADFSLSATYLVDDDWIVRGEAQLGLLMDGAADSPIVLDKWQPSAMLVVGYRF